MSVRPPFWPSAWRPPMAVPWQWSPPPAPRWPTCCPLRWRRTAPVSPCCCSRRIAPPGSKTAAPTRRLTRNLFCSRPAAGSAVERQTVSTPKPTTSSMPWRFRPGSKPRVQALGRRERFTSTCPSRSRCTPRSSSSNSWFRLCSRPLLSLSLRPRSVQRLASIQSARGL